MRRAGSFRLSALVAFFVATLPAAASADPRNASPAEAVRLEAPPFTIQAASRLLSQASRIAGLAPGLAGRAAEDLGLPPLRHGTITVLAGTRPDDPFHDTAVSMPSWAAGQAFPASGSILIRLDRIGTYGQREIGSVLAHEIAHLIIGAALPGAGRELPSWFSEGTASAVAREGEWRDTWIVWTSVLVGSEHPFADLEAALVRGEMDRSLAYAGSLAAVTFLRRAHGRDLPARVVASLRRGSDFEAAFQQAAGVPLTQAERAWREDLSRPRTWLLWIGSTFTLWIVATLLILLAYALKRHRSRRVLEGWRLEEGIGVPGEGEKGPAGRNEESIH